MNNKTFWKKGLSTSIFVIILVVLLHCFELSIIDDSGRFIRVQMHEFYNEKDVDTVILGASPAIYAFNVQKMEESGMENVFSLATSNQLAIGGYYLLKEALARHDIKTVIYHASYVRFGTNNANMQGNYIVLDSMRPSWNKFAYAYDALGEFGYVDLLSKYQRCRESLSFKTMWDTLWRKLRDKDYMNYYKDALVPATDRTYVGKGYCYSSHVMERGSAEAHIGKYYEDSPDWEYLEKTIELCKENDVEFILVQVPGFESKRFIDVESYQAGEEKLIQIAQKYDVPYWNFNEVKEQYLSLDEDEYFDRSHFNKWGGDIFMEFFMKIWNEYKIKGDVFETYCYKDWEEFEQDHRRIYGSDLSVESQGDTIQCDLKTVQASDVQPEYKYRLMVGDILIAETDWIGEKQYSFANIQAGEYNITAMARAVGSTADYEVIQRTEVRVE